MTFEEKLRNYAELLITVGLNVQKDQHVQIGTEVIHRDLALLLVELAYKRGAKYVNVDLSDSRFHRARILHSPDKHLTAVPDYIETKYRSLVDETAANLRILGSEDPDILSDLDPVKVNAAQLALRRKISYFYDEGIGKSLVQWTVAAAATPGWAKKVFPDLSPDEGCSKLWDLIFAVCRADKPNCIELWNEHNYKLMTRAAKLSEMGIERLHFTGPGTDLHVFLSDHAIFRAGTDVSPNGARFEANIPTEEVFTTPDCRKTTGTAKASRPFLVNGKLICGLELEFSDGKITSFSASQGEDTFREYIKSDDGASRLGEVALVGIDSPVYQSGRIFQEILYDENAACHIAIGSAYKFCLKDGGTLSKEELAAIGCNDSRTHTDIMISSEEVDVHARTSSGSEIALIKNGEWIWQQ